MISEDPKPRGKCILCQTVFVIGEGHSCGETTVNEINTNLAIDNAKRHLTPPKQIDVTEHEDGRKDVNIQVNRLDVDVHDEATRHAKDVIENQILPELAKSPVVVIVLHKPTNASAYKVVRLCDVRKYAETAVDVFMKTQATAENMGRVEDFVIIEYHIKHNEIKISSL